MSCRHSMIADEGSPNRDHHDRNQDRPDDGDLRSDQLVEIPAKRSVTLAPV